MLKFVYAFSASIKKIIWFLSFILLTWCITFILQMLNYPCVSGINPTWSWYVIVLMYYWIWFASILLRISASMLIRDIGLWFFFFSCGVLVWFWYEGNADLVESVWRCFLLFCFLEEFEKECYGFFSKCLVEFVSEVIWFCTFICWEFLKLLINFLNNWSL